MTQDMGTADQQTSRADRAEGLFRRGCNCSQSVFAAFADLYGIDFETAMRVSASFGAGIGRMRETCGAACGLFMLAGLYDSATAPEDKEAKSRNYKLVQELAAKFKERNGHLKCSLMLGTLAEKTISPVAQERTAEYYKKRPCPHIVHEAAAIWEEFIAENGLTRPQMKQE